MTDTACPSCDAPAPAGARRCPRCGYEFLEDGGAGPGRPRPSGRGLAAVLAAGTLVAAGGVAGVALIGNGDGEKAAAGGGEPQQPQHEVVSRHPLSKPAAERVLTRLYLSIPDDDVADVRCSRREPRPAHSVRRCHILYPGGTDHTIRTVVVITTANGAEVLSEP